MKKSLSLPIVLFMISFTSLTGVLITPALPIISQTFAISASKSNELMTVFLLGYALGQLPFGPLANKYGRKHSLLLGIGLSFLGSIFQLYAVYSSNMPLLLVGRFVCAFGGAAGTVLAILLITDVYAEKESRKVMSTVILFFSIMPSIAIFIGGEVVSKIQWPVLFWIVLTVNFLAIFLGFKVEETLTHDEKNHTLCLREILCGFANLFKSPSYLSYVFLFSIGTIVCYLFNSLAPVITITKLHYPASSFGTLSIITSLGLLFGSLSSHYLHHKLSGRQLVILAVFGILLSNTVSLLLFKYYTISIFTLFVPAFVFFACAGLIMSNGAILALSQVTDKASGTSFMNTANLLTSSLIVWVGGRYISTSQIVLPLLLAIVAILGLVVIHFQKNISICK